MTTPDEARDRGRFLLYFAVKLAAAGLFVAAALLYRHGHGWFALPPLLAGIAALLARPRHLFRDRR